jgi:hypothetical protein
VLKLYLKKTGNDTKIKYFVDVGLLGCNVVWTCMQIPMFRRNILPPSSGLKILILDKI